MFCHDNVCTSCCVLPDILQRNFLQCENLGSQKGAKIFYWMAEHGGRDGVVFLQEILLG